MAQGKVCIRVISARVQPGCEGVLQ